MLKTNNLSIALQQFPEPHSGESLPPMGDEECACRAPAEEQFPRTIEPLAHTLTGEFTEWHPALFAALAAHQHRCSVEVHVFDREAHKFAHPHSGRIQHFEHGPIAHPHRRVSRGRFEERRHLGYLQESRQRLLMAWRIDVGRRIARGVPLFFEKSMKGAYPRQRTRSAPCGESAGRRRMGGQVFEHVFAVRFHDAPIPRPEDVEVLPYVSRVGIDRLR